MPKATRCCICRDQRRFGELRDLMFIETKDGEDSSAMYVRGWMCEECAVVHWAEPPESWKVD